MSRAQRVRMLLSVMVSCGFLLVMGSSSASASPDTDRFTAVGAAIAPVVVTVDREAFTASTAVDAGPVVGPILPSSPSRAPALGSGEMRKAPIKLEGPNAPTPFGLSLAGLAGLGLWMHRRRRRMNCPLI